MASTTNSSGGAKAGSFGAKELYIRGFPYANTAAKFWTSVLDEVFAAYPQGTALEMAASSGGLLMPTLLMPELILQRGMDRLAAQGDQETLQDAIAVLELTGPPGSISLRMIPPGKNAAPQAIELDYLDADLLPFLLAWLLEWASIPDVLWNQPRVRGAFAGDDPSRRFRYLVAFELRSRLLGEELYHRNLRLHFRREPLAPPEAAEPANPE